MSLTKDGFYKSFGGTVGDNTFVLLAGGGHMAIHQSTNNEANKLVRTDNNGYLQAGWISTTPDEMPANTQFTKIYVSNDNYIRYKSKANFGAELRDSGALDGRYVLKTGDTMSGHLKMAGTKNLATAWDAGVIAGADGHTKVVMSYLASNTNGAVIGAHDSNLSNWAILNISGSQLIFRNNETERMRLDTNGRLGFGTDTPLAKLHIVQTSGTSAPAANANAGVYIVESGNAWAMRSFEILAPNLTADKSPFFVIGKADSAKNMAWIGYVHKADGGNENRLSFGLHSVDNIMNILSSGNVGIGTITPAEKLHVVGNTRITGTLDILDEARLKIWNVTSTRNASYGAEMVFLQTSIDKADPATSRPAPTRNDLFIQPYGGHVTIGPRVTHHDYALFVEGTSLFNSRLTLKYPSNRVITGTGTAASDAGADANPRYFPAKWTFNISHTPVDGDVIVIKIPVAGHTHGVYISLNNGTNYNPVVVDGANRLTTHYPVNTYLTLVYEANSVANNIFAAAGGNTRINNVKGVWRVANYYNYDTVHAICQTDAATAAKTATASYFALRAHCTFTIYMQYANSYQGTITLNINGTGAKQVWINGTVSSATNYTLPAGAYFVYYDGSKYYLRTDAFITTNITGSAAKWTTARKFTIGSAAAKNVDGSADVTWTAAEIAGSHNHNGGAAKTAWGQTYVTAAGVLQSVEGNIIRTGNITPATTAASSLGATNLRWLNIYGRNLQSDVELLLISGASKTIEFRISNIVVGAMNQVSNQGRLGIGTTSPAEKLHVVGGNIANDGCVFNYSKANNSGGYFIRGGVVTDSSNGTTDWKDYARLYITSIGTASNGTTQGAQGEACLVLGNNIVRQPATATTGINNAQGVLSLYGSGANYTNIRPQPNGNRNFYLPNYAGDMYAVHAGNNNAVGSATQAVYVAANGRVTAVTSSVNGGTATRIAYYSATNTISSGNIITDGNYLRNITYLQVNNNDNQTDYRLKVTGKSYFSETIYVAGQPAIQTAAGTNNLNYIRIHNGSNLWDIGSKSNSNSGALEFRPAGSDNTGPRIQTNGRFEIATTLNNDANYSGSAGWIREYHFGGAQTDNWGHAPRLGWHWSGRVAAQIGLSSNGWLYEAPLTATNFYRIVCETTTVTWGINISGNAATATNATLASTVTVNDSNANSTYRMVWHSGSTLYSTDNIYCNPSTDALYAKNFVSTVATGTQPYACTSTTLNTNLNADLLDGIHANGLFTVFSNPGTQITRITIGGTTKDLKIDADMLDGIHANGLFTAFGNSGNNITATIGGTTKSFTVGYATLANTVNVNNSDTNSTYRMVFHSGSSLYSTSNIYCNPSTDVLYTNGLFANVSGNGTTSGLSLYGTDYTYGLVFRTTANRGKWGDVQGDWATYSIMSTDVQRGWVWQCGTAEANMSASLSVRGVFAARAVGNSGGYLAFPQNNSYSNNSGTVTGALKITLPRYKSNTMIMFDVNIFTYDESPSNIVTYRIGGYEYETKGFNPYTSKVYSWGRGNKVNLKVRFGYDGSKTCVTIGETNTTWRYPQVSISNVTYGYADVTIASWGYGWGISFVTSLPSQISDTIENPYADGMYWADQRVSPTSSTVTTPTFGQVMVNTTTTTYNVNVGGDIYSSQWMRAINGLYIENSGVHYTHKGSFGEIYLSSNNVFNFTTGSWSTLYINYGSDKFGTTYVNDYVWNGGLSTTYASHTMGHLSVCANSENVSPSTAALEVRERGRLTTSITHNAANAPRIGFHWGSKYWANLAYFDNYFRFYNNDCSEYEPVYAKNYISTVPTGTQPYACTSTTLNTNLNADLLDGLHIHSGRNNEANKVVRTDGSGYIQAGWINTTSGDMGSTAFSRIYVSNDDYIRYVSVAQFKTGLFGSQVGSVSVPIYWTGSAFATCIVSFGNQNNGEHNANNINDNGIKYYNSNGPSTSLGASTSDGALYSQAYSTSWVGQIAQDYRNGGLYVRGKNNGSWQSWYRVYDSRTTYVSSGKGYIGGTEITQVNNAINATNATLANTINVNDSNTNGTFRMVFHSSNYLYSTDKIYCNPSTDAIYSTSIYTTDKSILANSTSFVGQPELSLLQSTYGLRSDYTSVGHPTEDYLKAWCKWVYAQTNVPGTTVHSFVSPNSRGYIFADIYASGINSTTKLPVYMSGKYFQLNGGEIIFGTYNGQWYYGHTITSLNISELSDYYLPLAGGWMDYDAQIYFKGVGQSTSVYSRIGYATSASGQTMHCINTSGNQANGAFYITSNGSTSANDTGGLAIDNEGVTVFGAGDAGSNFTGVFRVLNEDKVDDGPQFIVTKNTGAAVKYNLTIGQNIVNGADKLYIVNGILRSTYSDGNSSCYLRVGPQNASYAHYSTDASYGHYFNKVINVDGDIYLYGTSVRMQKSNGYVYSSGFYHNSYGSATYLLRSDGGVSAFNWSGKSGQPSWIWGGDSQHTYYVYNPSNFSVNYATSAGNADTVDGIHANGLFTAFGNSGNNITATIGGTTKSFTVGYATSAGNADTVDGHHQDHLLPYRYTYEAQTNNGSTDWYVRIQTTTYINEDCTIYVRGVGNNTFSDFVLHVLCRENRFWGWQTSYNGVRIDGIAKETSASEIIYLKMPSSTTSITFKSTHSLTIDKANYSSKSYMSLGEGLFANYIYGKIQNADYATSATSATSAEYLNYSYITDPANGYLDTKLKWFGGIPASSGYAGNNYGFPVSSNANGILWMGTHGGNYGGQLGVSSNGSLYYRYIINGSFPTTANGGSWKIILDNINKHAVYGTKGSTSYIKIKINSTKSWMLSFMVRVYQSYNHYDIVFSGYNYGSNYWYSPQAILTSSTTTSIVVYFGYESVDNLFVVITGGNYTGVEILNVTNGYTQIDDKLVLSNLFTITNSSSLPTTIQKTDSSGKLQSICNSSTGAITIYRPWMCNETVTNADTVDNEHAAAFAHRQTYNNMIHSGNEFTWVSPQFSGTVWMNYRTSSGSADGNITEYHMGDGKTGHAAVVSSGYKIYNIDNSYVLLGGGGYEEKSNFYRNLGGGNSVEITVNGNANTYYPVVIGSPSDYFPYQFVNITRTYNETAPNTWNTSTHRGGLSMALFWNGSNYWDGNAGGAEAFVVRLYQSYSTMVGGVGNSTSGKVVWLRGGGAKYHIFSMNGRSQGVTVYDGVANSSTYKDSANQSFAPKTTPDTITVQWPGDIQNSAGYLRDRSDGTTTYANYGAAGLALSSITWLTCWNGYELRAISKGELAGLTLVSQNTTNDTYYPLVWSNQTNTSSVQTSQLYKSYDNLGYNPQKKIIRTTGIDASLVPWQITDLNLCNNNGIYFYSGNSTGKPWIYYPLNVTGIGGYGISYANVLNISNQTNPTPGTNNHWINQLCFSVDTDNGGCKRDSIWFRSRINTGAWGNWQMILTNNFAEVNSVLQIGGKSTNLDDRNQQNTMGGLRIVPIIISTTDINLQGNQYKKNIPTYICHTNITLTKNSNIYLPEPSQDLLGHIIIISGTLKNDDLHTYITYNNSMECFVNSNGIVVTGLKITRHGDSSRKFFAKMLMCMNLNPISGRLYYWVDLTNVN